MTSKKHRFLHPSLNITCYSKLYKMIWPFVKFPCFMLGSLSFMFPCFQHKKDVEVGCDRSDNEDVEGGGEEEEFS